MNARINVGIKCRWLFIGLRWSSGYDARLTRERSPVQSWDEVVLVFSKFSRKTNRDENMRTPGIEPGAQAWEACMLPLHYERLRTVAAFHSIGGPQL